MSTLIKLSHEEFKEAVTKRNLIFQLKRRRTFAYYPLPHYKKLIIRFLSALMFLPVVGIPAISYFAHSWILLLGYVGWYLGIVLAGINNKTSNPIKSFKGLVLSSGFLLIILVFALGFINAISFIFFCYMYEFITASLNDILTTDFIKRSLLKSKTDYDLAVENEHIKTFLKK